MRRIALAVFLALLCHCGEADPPLAVPTGASGLTVSSQAIQDGTIAKRHTCDGAGISIDLTWTGNSAADSYAVTMIDPDAPGGSFVHWVLYDIPASTTSFTAGEVPKDSFQAVTDFGIDSYGGPCPPEGDEPHRYVVTVYALSGDPGIEEGAAAADAVEAIGCCVVAAGSITGTYRR